MNIKTNIEKMNKRLENKINSGMLRLQNINRNGKVKEGINEKM